MSSNVLVLVGHKLVPHKELDGKVLGIFKITYMKFWREQAFTMRFDSLLSTACMV